MATLPVQTRNYKLVLKRETNMLAQQRNDQKPFAALNVNIFGSSLKHRWKGSGF